MASAVRGGILWATLVVVLAVGTAQADDADERKVQAKAMFEEGLRLYNKGQYEPACERFERSIDLHPNINNRGKLAECYEKVGRVASAWRLYQQVEQRARAIGDERRANVARDRVTALQPRLARMIIEAPGVATTPGLVVTRSEQVVEPRALGTEQVLDPGSYRIAARAPGYIAHERVVQLAEGQVETVRIPSLERIPEAAGAGGSASPVLRYSGFALVGAGGIGLATSLYFGNRARTEWSSISPGCIDDALLCANYDYARQASAERHGTRANYAALAGAALLVGGATMWWLGRDRGRTTDRSAWLLTPVVDGRQLAVVLSGRL